MLIKETMTYFTCHQNIRPKVLKYDSFIIPLGECLSKKKNLRPILNNKKTHLEKNYVTMNDLMDNFMEKLILLV